MIKNPEWKHDLITVVISLCFYGFFCFFDGAVICVDSPSYIEMSLSREPLYPTFLAVNRLLFGTERYLFVCVLWQSLLAAAGVFILTNYLRHELEFRVLWSYAPLCICFGVSLLCRFVAARGAMYSNSILTEGIVCPLFLIFVRFLYDYLLHHGKRELWICAGLSLLMILTRKQMYLSLILLFLAVLYAGRAIKIAWYKSFLRAVAVAAGILLFNFALDNLYHLEVNGDAVTHFNDNRFLATVAFYTAERGDGERISDAELRALFYEIYDICDSEGSMMHDAPRGIFALADHFGAHYDMIQIDHMWPMIECYAADHIEGNDPVQREILTDEATSELTRALLPVELKRIGRVAFAEFLHGLINTSAKAGGILNFTGLAFWAAFAVLFGLRIGRQGFDKISVFALLVLASSVLNIFIVSAVIFCQTRYMIYNMPLFWIGFVLLAIPGIALPGEER